jgi:transposase-like protein
MMASELTEDSMGKQRKQYSGEFKARVALEAIKGQRTVSEIASRYSVHPHQVSQWKKQAIEQMAESLGDRRARRDKSEDELKAQLYQEIGQLKVELDWLKKRVGLAD